MRCGISTSCYYPEDTLESLRHVVASGAKVTEVFLNTFSELEPTYIQELDRVARDGGVQVLSLHPFSSMLEGFFFGTPYDGRLQDGLALYHRFFEACTVLGARLMVYHGDRAQNATNWSDARYAESFCRVAEVGRQYGVTLCQENVSYCRMGMPETIRRIRPLLGGYAAFVLDIKQQRRAGYTLDDMLDAMAGGIRHLHISDADAGHDCIAPGTGSFDFGSFITKAQSAGYTGDMVIELYRDGYTDEAALAASLCYMERLLG